jgi:serine/threonine protein phosphatase 1
MGALPLWYEDDNGLYVHAGLEEKAEGTWCHPSKSQPKPLMWMREPKFFRTYKGKRLCVGHTPVVDLPLYRPEAEQTEAYLHGDLAAIDTGAGKGGFLTAIELPGMKLYDSR